MPAYNSTTAFNDFLIATREHYLNDGKVVNLTGYQRYLFDQFTKGKADEEIIQGGDKIIVNLNIANPENGGTRLPAEPVQRHAHNGLTTAETGWRFDFDSYTWTEQQVALNKGPEQLVNFAQQLRTQFRQGMHTRMEKKLWATPNAELMEGVGAREPYSLLCFITDDGGLPSGFTTLMNYDWALGGNKVGTYTVGDYDSLVDAFDDMFLQLDWEASGASAEWQEETDWQKFLILTNRAGRNMVSRAIRDAQGGNVIISNGNKSDVGVIAQAAQINGVKVQYIPYTDELNWPSPKFYMPTTQFLHPVYHSEWYMKEKDPKEFEDNPLTWYVDVHTWYNFVCKARHRHGLIKAA